MKSVLFLSFCFQKGESSLDVDKEIEIGENHSKNNQYCQYDRVPTILKRYSFDEKCGSAINIRTKFFKKRISET